MINQLRGPSGPFLLPERLPGKVQNQVAIQAFITAYKVVYYADNSLY